MEMLVRVMEMHVPFSHQLAEQIVNAEKKKRPSGDAWEPSADWSLIAAPNNVIARPRAAVTSTWPVPASAVTAIVLEAFHLWTRAVRTNGNQWVGIAAWKKATPKPVSARVVRTVWFMNAVEDQPAPMEPDNPRPEWRGIYRADRIRTCDLSHPRRTLYQAEPQPELMPGSWQPRHSYLAYFSARGKQRNTGSICRFKIPTI